METTKNYKTLGELEDKYFGKPGTLEREQYEFELSMEIIGEKLKQIRIYLPQILHDDSIERQHLTRKPPAEPSSHHDTYIDTHILKRELLRNIFLEIKEVF